MCVWSNPVQRHERVRDLQEHEWNYELPVIRNVTGRQAECAGQGEKCIVIFSHLHSSLVHISV